MGCLELLTGLIVVILHDNFQQLQINESNEARERPSRKLA
jgi:hypothetical protein